MFVAFRSKWRANARSYTHLTLLNSSWEQMRYSDQVVKLVHLDRFGQLDGPVHADYIKVLEAAYSFRHRTATAAACAWAQVSRDVTQCH